MTIGEALAQARREAGLSVADVSRRTRIRETIINGIERDDFSPCRGDFYARGHIRAIAHVIGIDPEPLVGEYDAAYLPPETIPGARRPPQATFEEEDPPLDPVAEDQAAEPVTPVDPHEAVTWREQDSGSGPFSLWQPVTRNQPPIPDEPATFGQDAPPRLPPGPDQTVSPGRADPPREGTTSDRPLPPPPQVTSEIPPGPVTPQTQSPVTPETPAPYEQDRSHYGQDPGHREHDLSPYRQRPISDGRRTGPGSGSAPEASNAMATPTGPVSHRRRGVNWSLVLGVALVVVLGLGGYLLASGGNSRQATSAAASHQAASRPRPTPSASHATPTTTPTHSAPPIQPLKPASIAAFGPAGAGQGDNPQLAQSALDGNAASGWHSDWYTTPHFGNLQPGTGLLLDMGHTVTLAGAQVAIGDVTGADIQLRAGSSPVLSNLAPVAHATDAGGTVNLHLTEPSQGRYVLVWFTKLPQDQAGTFQASVSSIKLQGSG